MAVNILENFITKKVRKGDVYVPSALLLLLKNKGKASVKQIAKLIYIFEKKHSLEKYEMIVKNMVVVILDQYSLITIKDDTIILNTWPIKDDDVQKLIMLCYKVSNGFFRNLKTQNQQKAA